MVATDIEQKSRLMEELPGNKSRCIIGSQLRQLAVVCGSTVYSGYKNILVEVLLVPYSQHVLIAIITNYMR